MKSPWNYLSRLTFRRESAISRDVPFNESAETEAAHIYPMTPEFRQEVAPPENPEVVYDGLAEQAAPHEESAAVFVEEVDETPIASDTPSSQEQKLVPGVSAVKLSRQPKKVVGPTIALQQSKKEQKAPQVRIVLTRGSSSSTHPVQGPKRLTREETFFDEVVGLEDDIKQLRLTLAKKLETQNRQLKAMLSRFEA